MGGVLVLYELLQPAMKSWYARLLSHATTVPSPRDEPVVGPLTGRRILLFGNGPTHGWGVASHGLAATGGLARSASALAGEPCSVMYVGDERMTVASSRSWLGSVVDHSFAAVVVAVGMNDAIRLTSPRRLAEHFSALLSAIGAAVKPGTPVIVVGIPPLRAFKMLDNFVGQIAAAHAARLNTVLKSLAAESGATYIASSGPAFSRDRPLGSPEAYEAWAREVAEAVVGCLPVASKAKAVVGGQNALTVAPELVTQLRSETPSSVRIGELVERAKQTMDADFAALKVLGGERAWFVSTTGNAPSWIPRELAYCDVVVGADAPLVVPNAHKDPRFIGNAWVDVVQLPFYAGVPVHSADGTAIGTLCALAHKPRTGARVDTSGLEELAREVEAELASVSAGGTASLASVSTAL